MIVLYKPQGQKRFQTNMRMNGLGQMSVARPASRTGVAICALLLLLATGTSSAHSQYDRFIDQYYFGKVFVDGQQAPPGTPVDAFLERTRRYKSDRQHYGRSLWSTYMPMAGETYSRPAIVRIPLHEGYELQPVEEIDTLSPMS